MKESLFIKNFGKVSLFFDTENIDSVLNEEILLGQVENRSGVFMWEDGNQQFIIAFLDGKPVYTCFYTENERIEGERGEKMFSLKTKGKLYLFTVPREMMIVFLSFFFGEELYKNLETKVLELTQFLDTLGEKKLTGILYAADEEEIFIPLFDGNILELKDGEIVSKTPLSSEADSELIMKFATVSMRPDTKLSFYSIDKDINLNPIELSVFKLRGEQLKNLAKDALAEVLRERVKRFENMIDSVKNLKELRDLIPKIKEDIFVLYNKKLSEDAEEALKRVTG